MSVPAQLDRFTVRDLAGVPDDGMHYEVVNGGLFVTPPAGYPHNRRAQHVGLALLAAAPSGFEVLMTGTQAVALPDGDGPCPDVVVFLPGDYAVAIPVGSVRLVAEVTGPGNRSNDTVTKLERYARSGIEHYWVVDPEEFRVYALDGDHYRLVVVGSRVEVDVPFPVTVDLLG